MELIPDRLGPDITRALGRIRRVSDVPLAFGGRVEDTGLTLRDFDGSVVGPLRDVALVPGHGVGGRVMLEQRSLAVVDYLATPSIVHTYDSIIRAEGLRTIVAAPVIVGRRMVAVLYAASRAAQTELGLLLDAVTGEARSLEQSLAVAETLMGVPTASPLNHRRDLSEPRARLLALSKHIDDPAIRAELIDVARALTGSNTPSTNSRLTRREMEVLLLLAAGLPNRVVAEKLGIGLHTVKKHVKHLMEKLGGRTRFELVVNARRDGAID